MPVLYEGHPFRYEDHESDEWATYLTAIQAGERVEITEDMMYYWLEVLPPALWRRNVELADGTTVRAAFGFAEGAELITAFWSEKLEDKRHYYAQRTKEMNQN